VLTLASPDTGLTSVVDLPAEGWKATGSGYRFRGRGACSRVLVKKGKLRAACKGADLDLPLTDAAQSRVAVRLDLGAKRSLCLEFGGDVKRDHGIGFGSPTARGSFMARAAPRPAGCPTF
jgi:hypothetical protein